MSTLKDITISNIKGYGDPPVVLPIELKTNRINLIFAPNGTGKSSLAAAFRSLTNRSLEVEKEYKYHKDEALSSSLSIKLDDVTFSADAAHNDISSNLQCQVINCATVVHTTQHNMGRFTSVSGYIDIENIEIESAVPSSSTGYAITSIRSDFGTNGKILPNLKEELNNHGFLLGLKSIWLHLDFFNNAQARRNLVNDVISHIHNLRGTAEVVHNSIDPSWLDLIEANPTYASICGYLDEVFPGLSRVDRFLCFFQLNVHWHKNKASIKATTAYAEYCQRREEYDRNLRLLDTTWCNIHTEESEGKLVVKFPRADEISNGQRDLLTFIVQIIKFKVMMRENKKYLLLIDEVFDYLDDANLIAAQYYLTSFLDITKDNIFLCLLSHLNPFTFRSYVFSDKKLNIQYLKNTVPVATQPMLAFISFREGLKDKPGEPQNLYHDLSHDLFHYDPTPVDYSTRIAALKTNHQLNETWGIASVLHQVLIAEVNKYFSGQPQYDPYAVAMALRLRVEKIMYEQLPANLRQGFVDEKMTKHKFEYCYKHQISVPDILYIVTAIHNEADHVKFDAVTNRYIEKPMVYKLQNNAVLGILKRVFEYNGIPLTTDVID